MITRSALLLFITLSSLLTYNCFSMQLEKEERIITLDQGLLTTIPGKITHIKYVNDGFFTTQEIYQFTEKKDSIINLLYHNIKTYEPSGGYFRPLIIKLIIKPHSIRRLGEYNKRKHREAKEAICQKKALYYTYKQGVLLYSLDEQPTPSLVKHVERMLEDNKYEMIIPQK